jgi:hypothetical protein
MSIASLFKPVDSSKTRLPRTDVLDRVAKYADGDLVISSYLDISTPELVKMLENNLVPASRLEEVQNIVRTRLTGETTAAPKTSVGETISTEPIKNLRVNAVSDPTEKFIKLQDIFGASKSDQQAKQSAMSPDPRATRNVREQTGWDQGYAGGIDAESVGRATRPAPPEPTEASILADQYRQYNAKPSFSEELGIRGLVGGAQRTGENISSAITNALGPLQAPSETPNLPSTRTREGETIYYPPEKTPQNRAEVAKQYEGKVDPMIGLIYGQSGVTEAENAANERKKLRDEASAIAAREAADKATTDRMAAREAGISALPLSTGGAAEAGTGGVAPPAFRSGSADVSGTAPASIGGRYVPPASGTSSTSSQPSATPPAFRSGLDDRPSKDDKKAIQETATAVAKNPSVGGIQSLFEQAGFSDALLQLGLGMMASKNPDFLGALGEAGQGAVALMAKQREEAKKAKLEADKLDLEKQRNAIYGRSVDNAATTDKRPAIVQTSEAYSTAIKTAKEQAKNNEFDTTEQFMARDYASKLLVPAAQEAAQKAAIAWDKIYDGLLSSKKKEYEEKNPKDAYVNKAYQASLQQNPTLYKLLNIGVPTEENKVKKFDLATGTLIN